jgi:putative sterol carrier protein
VSAVRFLSQEWADALTEALNGDDDFRTLTRKKQTVLAFNVHGTPEGDVSYHMTVDQGTGRVVLGPTPGADVTFELDYDVARQLVQGELDGQKAVMSGQMTHDQSMFKLMQFGPVLQQRTKLERELPLEF